MAPKTIKVDLEHPTKNWTCLLCPGREDPALNNMNGKETSHRSNIFQHVPTNSMSVVAQATCRWCHSSRCACCRSWPRASNMCSLAVRLSILCQTWSTSRRNNTTFPWACHVKICQVSTALCDGSECVHGHATRNVEVRKVFFPQPVRNSTQL
jgi:hypothetical protein